mgnify:CR=1 FL=1
MIRTSHRPIHSPLPQVIGPSGLDVLDVFNFNDDVRENAAAFDNMALRWAAGNGHLEVVNRLLEIDAVRANAEARDNEALRWAAKNGHLEVVNGIQKKH